MQALKDFSWFFVILLALAIVWVLSGGPYSESAKNPFIKPPSPLDSGDTYGFGLFPDTKSGTSTTNGTGFGTTYGEGLFSGTKSNASTGTESISEQLKNIGTETAQIKEELEKAEEKTNKSEYADLITISRAGAMSITPDREYLEISLSKTAKNKVIITGWTLKSLMSGISVKIEDASWLPRLGGSNTKNTIVLSPGNKAIINTGRSPIGTSFRTNICTGYFSQFQSFYPSLKRNCPDPSEDIEDKYLSGPNAYNDQCLDFIDRIQTCNINTSSLPLNMQSQCQDFVTKKMNYNSCIDTHKNDEGFYGTEWRIYLSRDTELWKSKREIIQLTDGIGKIIGTVTY
ncbi:MAG: hypothetical protein WC849_02265 [Candidatus Paceibacterota bacterium]